MAILQFPISLNYRDAKGFVYHDRYNITGDGSSPTLDADFVTLTTALEAAVANLSNAAFSSSTWPFNKRTLTYGGTGVYQAGWMKAVMTFTTDTGAISRFKIPAPLEAIFDSDGITVINDGTQAAVVAYVNAVKNAVNTVFVSSAGGQPFTHFVGGILRFGKQPRRFNEFVKSSHLVQGEGE